MAWCARSTSSRSRDRPASASRAGRRYVVLRQPHSIARPPFQRRAPPGNREQPDAVRHGAPSDAGGRRGRACSCRRRCRRRPTAVAARQRQPAACDVLACRQIAVTSAVRAQARVPQLGRKRAASSREVVPRPERPSSRPLLRHPRVHPSPHLAETRAPPPRADRDAPRAALLRHPRRSVRAPRLDFRLSPISLHPWASKPSIFSLITTIGASGFSVGARVVPGNVRRPG